MKAQVEAALTQIERVMGVRFGDPTNPLLVSVRSGARASMPGMMDTVLNLGLNDETVEGLAKQSGDERFAWDTIALHSEYSNVVMASITTSSRKSSNAIKRFAATTTIPS